jgi:hypothetical protein
MYGMMISIERKVFRQKQISLPVVIRDLQLVDVIGWEARDSSYGVAFGEKLYERFVIVDGQQMCSSGRFGFKARTVLASPGLIFLLHMLY